MSPVAIPEPIDATRRVELLDQASALLSRYATFTYGEISHLDESQRPESYFVLDLSRVYGGEGMADGTAGSSLWRLGVRSVSVDADNAHYLLDYATTTLEGASLTAVGSTSGPIEFETERPVLPDDGMFSGSVDWTFDFS